MTNEQRERPTEALRERIKAYDAEESPWQQTIGKADMYHEADRIDATIAALAAEVGRLWEALDRIVAHIDHDENCACAVEFADIKRVAHAALTPPADQPAPEDER